MKKKKTNNNQMNKDKKICHFWATEKCKFGQNCNYEHPTRCIYQPMISFLQDIYITKIYYYQ